jgi:hypothetical protein
MTIQNYRVYYGTVPNTFIGYLDNVQNIQITVGRQKQLDQIKASTANISLRYPTGFASPIAELVTGTYIAVYNITNDLYSNYPVWFGRITDVVASYGIPYQSGVGPADYLEISCEGNFAALGRMEGNGYSMAAGDVSTQIATASTQTGITINAQPASITTPVAATTVSTTWADWVARVCQSTNSRLWDGGTAAESTVVSPFIGYTAQVFFGDTNAPYEQNYSQINFDSYSDNYYTQVTVDPESFSPSTVTKAGAAAPYRTYQTNTLNASTAQATDYANYLLANYSDPKLGISSVTCIAEAQTSFRLDRAGYNNSLGSAPGCRTTVQFRGVVYYCVIEGVTMSASPAGATFTFYLSAEDLNAYLILNDNFFGKLDENRLAY